MTVAELITKLGEFPPDMLVIMSRPGWYGELDYDEVDVLCPVNEYYTAHKGNVKAVEVHW